MEKQGETHLPQSTEPVARPRAITAAPKAIAQQGAAASELLHALSNEQLPLVLAIDGQMEAAAVLVQAGHVRATMQLVPCPWGGFPQAAVVIGEITCSGLVFLQASSGPD